MHSDELWQEFDTTGTRIAGKGREPSLGNPRTGEDVYVGAASTWLYRRTEKGIEVLFQQRSMNVDNNAGKWDVSAGGHINQGETVLDAAVRELNEELGVKIEPEKLEFIFQLKTFFEVQMFTNFFMCDFTGREDEINFSDGEVQAVKWVPLAEFDEFVDANVKKPIQQAFFTRELTKFWMKKHGDS